MCSKQMVPKMVGLSWAAEYNSNKVSNGMPKVNVRVICNPVSDKKKKNTEEMNILSPNG